ncbi:MAG: hypothetical protein IJZ83_06755 [Clostridia bacterium]|nr:hypothetical protein [Clostridia bacterium]
MKKSISIFLVTVMILTVCITAFSTVFANAETQSTELPASKFTGDSQKLAQLQAAYEADIAAATKTQYDIQSADELYALFKAINAKNATFENWSIKLKCDIIFNEGNSNTWGDTPASYTDWPTVTTWFKGTFDGENHTISGIYISKGTSTGIAAIFKNTTTGAKIKNIGLLNSYVCGSTQVGAIVANAYGNTNLINCYSDATVVANADVAGGIVGWDRTEGNGLVDSCVFSGYVEGQKESSGIVGTARTSATVIKNCANFGTIVANVGTYGHAAGIVSNLHSGTVEKCINFGNITSAKNDMTGSAICGGVKSTASATSIKDCYLVSGLEQTQKLVGVNDFGASNSWTYSTISANSIKGDAAKTALAAFDFDNEKIWSTRENDYPVPTAVKTILEGIVPNIGAQLSVDTYTTEGENGYTAQKLRFLAGIDSTADFETIGFIITESKSGQRWNVSGNTVYESVIVATLSGNKVVNASEYDVNYLFALTLDDIPATVDAEFVAIPYAIPTSGNITYYGEAVTYTVTETSIAIK